MDVLSEAEDKNKKHNNYWIYFFRQLFSCSSVVINFFMFGVYLGAPTVIIPQLRKEVNSTEFISTETASWMSSTMTYSGTPWVIIIPLISYRFGRKIGLMLVTLIIFIGNIFFYFSNTVTDLIISLAMQGALAASIMTISLMILSEYTSPKYRGIFMTFKTATLFWGVWVSNAIGTFCHWRNICIVVTICGFYNLSTVFYKESPYWLATKGRFDECAKVHRWLKGTDEDSEEELRKLILSHQELLNDQTKFKSVKEVKIYMKIMTIIRSKVFYKPFVFGLLLTFLYNSTGKMACTVYAIDIIKRITSNEQMAFKGMLILDGVTVVGMYCGSAVSKIVTRRKQLLGLSSAGVVFLYILSIYLYLIRFEVILENTYVSLFLLAGYSMCISCGPLILLPTCSGELSPLRYRSYYLCFTSIFYIIILATYVKIAPLIFKHCGTPGAFLFFALVSSAFICILYKYFPETKDKTIQEIEENIVQGDSRERNIIMTETMVLNKPLCKD